jgi:uncharacterized damage-inducible protein DinB
MAKYNERMNHQILSVVESLNPIDLTENKGAYFKSIIGTLNHILVGDIIWLSRFNFHSESYISLKCVTELPKPQSLSDILYPDLKSYKYARKIVDSAVINWLNKDINASDFNRNLEYSNTAGIKSSRNFGELVSHLFNHQTHHRGQVSTLLNQIGYDIGATDFLLDIPEMSA